MWQDGWPAARAPDTVGGLRSFAIRSVLDRAGWSDHAPLALVLKVPNDTPDSRERRVEIQPRKRARVELPRDSALDESYADLVLAARSTTLTDRLRSLYGPVIADSAKGTPVKVWTDGSSLNNGRRGASAGAGVFFGPGNRHNIAQRVPDAQTNNRAEVFAVLLALAAVSPAVPLIVHSDSQYAIQSVTTWAPDNADAGWSCKNGDILKDCAAWIRARPARVHFEHVRAHSDDKSNDAADALAKRGAGKPAAAPYHHQRVQAPPTPAAAPDVTVLSLDKVSSSLAPPPKLNKQRRIKPAFKVSESDRGRDRKRYRQDSKLSLLLGSARDSGLFWRTIKHDYDAIPPQVTVSLAELTPEFMRRMNKPEHPPPELDRAAARLAQLQARDLSTITPHLEPDGFFAEPFTMEDIAWLKKHMRERSLEGAPGYDGVSKSELMIIANDDLAALFSRCIEENDVPGVWLTTEVVAILKRDKPEHEAASYRTVGLESIALKMLTLLVHRRLTQWADQHDLLPPTQNGFRQGYRTANNALVLRCLIEKAHAMKIPLYVAFVDVTNAFPSTDRDLLWVKLHRMGISGPMIDWLRNLYRRMSYVVRTSEGSSEAFEADVGVLIGDSASPTLWNLFLADLNLLPRSDDPVLGGVLVSLLAHADDLVLVSTSPAGLQARLNAVFRYCRINQLVTHPGKTVLMLFGEIPAVVPQFYMNGVKLAYKDTWTYVGVTFTSTKGNLFYEHYVGRRKKALAAVFQILGLDLDVGRLPPWPARLLWMARPDAYLTGGADIIPDIDKLADPLEDVQVMFLRRILGLGPSSLHAPLFTETGIAPLRFRRLILALRYLRYAVSLPESHMVSAALRESYAMYTATVSGWIGDIAWALKNRLPSTHIRLPSLADLKEDGAVDALIRQVEKAMRDHLQGEINERSKLYLLRDRQEPASRDGPLQAAAILRFRPYLNVVREDHRFALTRLLLSHHPLALEVLRHEDLTLGRKFVPREHRLCRFCAGAVESPEHALLECMANTTLPLIRARFFAQVERLRPDLVPPISARPTPDAMRALLDWPDFVHVLAAFTNAVLSVFTSVEYVWPAQFKVPPRPRRQQRQKG
ncbi:unnamed protein product [Peniophora sp. CBMAI 1063]|nr:unnamed protein product [Peniophora sp. CBMAI 1063]